jgi:hypothetical protein
VQVLGVIFPSRRNGAAQHRRLQGWGVCFGLPSRRQFATASGPVAAPRFLKNDFAINVTREQKLALSGSHVSHRSTLMRSTNSWSSNKIGALDATQSNEGIDRPRNSR